MLDPEFTVSLNIVQRVVLPFLDHLASQSLLQLLSLLLHGIDYNPALAGPEV